MKSPGGLSSHEAQARLARFGTNEITQKVRHSSFTLLISQFKSPLVIILLIATMISLVLGDTLEGVLIILIVVFNAALGFFQEQKAEKALEALKQITISTIRVVRDTHEHEIDSKFLVPGDIIIIEEGNKVPADAKLLHGMHLEVDESSLTGESMSIEKSANNPDERALYLGTTIARGRGTALVTATGMNTRFGKIASELSTIVKEETPLEKKLAMVAKQLGILALAASLIMVAIGFSRGVSILTLLLTAISLAVAAVPEGLPAVITVTLAVGTQRMAKKKAILRKLNAIEALGSISIIATDKTGTLTKNEMHVAALWADNMNISLQNNAILSSNPIVKMLITAGVVCNNASLAPIKDHGSFDVVGDKTEGALLLLAEHMAFHYRELKNDGKLLEEFAFDPTTKTMSVVWGYKSGTHIYAKGAPEAILERSTRMLSADGEKILSASEKVRITHAFESYAKRGLRMIALATKKTSWPNHHARHIIESDLTFIGFVGISDPPRPEVEKAIQVAQNAGIKTIMITGDNELTALAIAQQIHLIKQGDEVMTGAQFASMSPQQRLARLPSIRVFARTTPEQKLEIVKLLQQLGHIVAVTGDGVNDALALKQANVGVAMGVTGTDVAKEAADMVITDDNYATLVTAVEEGRIIYENMKASIKYLIGSNIGEIFSLLIAALLGWPFILLPLQILYINLITDGLPALALALNNSHHNIMHQTPRSERELFTRFDLRWFVEVSSLTVLSTLFAFWIGWRQQNLDLARTLAFVIIALAQQYIFMDIIAGERSMFSLKLIKNIWVIIPVSVMALQILIAHTPIFRETFHIVSPHWVALIASVAFCSLMVLTSEIRKRFARHIFYAPNSS